MHADIYMYICIYIYIYYVDIYIICVYIIWYPPPLTYAFSFFLSCSGAKEFQKMLVLPSFSAVEFQKMLVLPALSENSAFFET